MLHPHIIYIPSTDYNAYTDYRVVFIIWIDDVNAICPTTISLNIHLWKWIAVFQRLYPHIIYMPNTDYTDYADYRVAFIIKIDKLTDLSWLTLTGIHRCQLAAGTSSWSAHNLNESK